MSNLDRRVADWMRSHRATVPTSVLDAVGLSESQRRRLVSSGVLERVVDGGYHFAGVEPGELSRCAALCGSRPHLVIAGPTAGRAWRIRRSPRDGLIHVISPPQSQPCREPWVRAYRTALLDADEIVTWPDGIRVTCPARTVVDLTRSLPDDALASAIEYVLSNGICTLDELCRVAERLNTPGRPWVRRFLRVLAHRLPGRPRESDWERRVCDALGARGVHDIESQVRQCVAGFGSARFDLAIPAIRLVIEVDAHPEHRTLEGQANDHRRDRRSRHDGWVVERVGEAELANRFDATISELVDAVCRRRAEVASLCAVGLWPPTPTR